MPKDHEVGQSTITCEDIRFLMGFDKYTDDISMLGEAHACFVRSDVAHGKIKSIDVTAAAAMPRADDLPFYTVDHSCATPCTHNPLGVKGCGEAGAIVNAVIDPLQSGGKPVTYIDTPLTPARVWSAMNAH